LSVVAFILIRTMQATTESTKTWTILTLIEWGTRYLADRGFDDARLNIELLLCHTLNLDRIHLYTNFDRQLNSGELLEFKTNLQRRLQHEPLQYIIGETEFMGIPLFVDSSVLIPRPETEELVQLALDFIKTLNRENTQILDIGTGSGNIPIAIEYHSTGTSIVSIDISAEALAVASRNIERNKCSRITLKQADVFQNILPESVFDLVIANPPYISVTEFETLQPEVRDFEPRIATTDDGDGFRFIRRILELASEKLASEGVMLMEIAYNQSDEARRIALDCGMERVDVLKDLGGNDRILRGYKAA
jgi:release factor glutamine methyltransferase